MSRCAMALSEVVLIKREVSREGGWMARCAMIAFLETVGESLPVIVCVDTEGAPGMVISPF